MLALHHIHRFLMRQELLIVELQVHQHVVILPDKRSASGIPFRIIAVVVAVGVAECQPVHQEERLRRFAAFGFLIAWPFGFQHGGEFCYHRFIDIDVLQMVVHLHFDGFYLPEQSLTLLLERPHVGVSIQRVCHRLEIGIHQSGCKTQIYIRLRYHDIVERLVYHEQS